MNFPEVHRSRALQAAKLTLGRNLRVALESSEEQITRLTVHFCRELGIVFLYEHNLMAFPGEWPAEQEG